MKSVLKNLYQSQIDHPFGNAVQSAAYFLRREQGNLLFYSSKFIVEHFAFIHRHGGLQNQIVNHRDEATEFCDAVLEEFAAPLICHEHEQHAILESCQVGQLITEGPLFFDLRAIHTPGHCPGSTCFLWQSESGNVLFTGDTFYPSYGKWLVAIDDGDQVQMIESLERLLKLEIDWIIPSLFIGDLAYLELKSKAQYRALISCCIDRLKNGAVH